MIELLRKYRLSVALAGVLLLYTVGGFFVLPHFVRSTATDFVTRELHKKLAIGDISFNPFTLALDVRDLALGDEHQSTVVGFRHLRVDLSWSSLWHLSPVFDEIVLERPEVAVVVRPDGSPNLRELIPAAPPSAEPAKPVEFAITHLRLSDGRVGFQDLSRPTPFNTQIVPINLALDEFSTRGDSQNRYQVHAVSAERERFDWAGTVRLNPLRSAGHLAVADLKAQTIWRYLRDALSFEMPAGTVALAGDYDFVLGADGPSLKMKLDQITVNDLGLRPIGGVDPYVTLGSLVVAQSALDLKARSITVGSVALERASVRAWMGADGLLNLDELRPKPGAPSTGTSTPSPAQEPARPWKVSVPRITVDGSTIEFEDRRETPTATLKVEALAVRIADFNNSGQGALGVEVSGTLNGAGQLATKGTVALDSMALALNVGFKDLDLRPLQPYLNERTDMTLLSGALSVDGDLKYRPGEAAAAIEFHGRVGSHDLRTVDNKLKEDFIRWKDLAIEGVAFTTQPQRLTIREVRARGPYARVIIAPDASVNITTVLRPARLRTQAAETDTKPGAERAATPAASAQPAMRIEIKKVRIDQGSANFADLSIRPKFAAGIQSLSGTVVGLSSKADARATVDLNGKVDQYAPVTIDGEVNYLSAQSYTDLRLVFQNMELTTFTPYSGKFAGYTIRKGKLSVNFKYHVENRKLRAEHNVVVDQLTLGDKVDSPDATKLPVKLAIALLKDRNGVINIDLPVTGDLDDPKFRLGPIIWKVFVNLITKIVTAPFKVLGSLFGGGDEVKYVDFTAGDATIDAATVERVRSVGKALLERPALEIEIPISFVDTLDRAALVDTALNARVLQVAEREQAKSRTLPMTPATLPADRKEYLRLLGLVYREQFNRKPDEITEPLLKGDQAKKDPAAAVEAAIRALSDELRATVTIVDTDLRALGQRRAEAVRALLLEGTGLEPARVFITAETPAGVEQGRVRMELALR
jgi:uncharacterized protein involved in outer membrane biogenesis